MDYRSASATPSNEGAPDKFFVLHHDDVGERSSDETSRSQSALSSPVSTRLGAKPPSQQLEETTPNPRPQPEKPTLSERIAFHQRCCEADEEELDSVDREIRAMEEALRAKRQEWEHIEERVVVSRRTLEMLMKQQQNHGTGNPSP